MNIHPEPTTLIHMIDQRVRAVDLTEIIDNHPVCTYSLFRVVFLRCIITVAGSFEMQMGQGIQRLS